MDSDRICYQIYLYSRGNIRGMDGVGLRNDDQMDKKIGRIWLRMTLSFVIIRLDINI